MYKRQIQCGDNSSGHHTVLYADNNGTARLHHPASDAERLRTTTAGTKVTGTVLAGSSSFAAENATYVLQAAAPSQAYISAYCGNTGTNLSNHGFHFGIDGTSHNIIARENKPIYFYINNSHALSIDTSKHLVPAGNNSQNLGSTSVRWANIYTNDLNLSNEGSKNDVDGTWGDYTIQEGESDLFLINKRSGKKYKFNLTEVS